MTAWLPSDAVAPFPSSPLIDERAVDTKDYALHPWTVSAFPISWEDLIMFLPLLSERKTLAEGITVGKEFFFVTTILRFAGSLVAREQFLPSIEKRTSGYYAEWEPIIADDDRASLLAFARSLPAVCCALTQPANFCNAEQTVLSLVTSFTDSMIRSSAAIGRLPALKRVRKHSSIHDEWLSALSSSDGVMRSPDKELASFQQHLFQWKSPIIVSSASPYRLCFRLCEPEKVVVRRAKSSTAWRVEYLLQHYVDKSLLVPMDDLWKGKQIPSTGSITMRELTQSVLVALGRAAHLDDRIKQSLKKKTPAGFQTDVHGAHQFLRESSSALEQSGFGVMLPSWWVGKGTKARLTIAASVIAPKTAVPGSLTLDSILHFNWQLALGGEQLSLKELQELAALKTPLIQRRGEWIEIDSAGIQMALARWKDNKPGSMTFGQMLRSSFGSAENVEGLDISAIQTSDWLASMLASLRGRETIEPLKPDEKFNGLLRAYQQVGFSWLAQLKQLHLGSCLADDMGLGKTIQVLAFLQSERRAGQRRPALIVAPMSVVNNWQKEAERFTPDLSVMVHHGSVRMRDAAFRKEAERHAIVVSTYALLHRDLEHLQAVSWSGIILDEAQNIKNAETKQHRAAKGLAADYRIALTGTPVENSVGDLWSIMDFLNPGYLGSRADFKRRFLIPIHTGQDPDAVHRLNTITSPFILRRLKTDPAVISDLPQKIETKEYCSLTKEQASLYSAVVLEAERAIASAEGIGRKGLILTTMIKLKQVCNHPAHFLRDNSSVARRSGKLARLHELMDEISAGTERLLLFTQFREMGAILKPYLQNVLAREIPFLHGGVSKKERDRMVEHFESGSGDIPMMILSLKAGGTGLNLTAANHVIHFDRWWNPAVENQATDRAFRIGQTKNVQVHKFICLGTLEENIDLMIEKKLSIAQSAIGSGEHWLTELSNEQLHELLALRRNALED
jgi:SNF2 family DNA or RNA helicase